MWRSAVRSPFGSNSFGAWKLVDESSVGVVVLLSDSLPPGELLERLPLGVATELLDPVSLAGAGVIGLSACCSDRSDGTFASLGNAGVGSSVDEEVAGVDST